MNTLARASVPLRVGDASAAIILIEDGRYLLQLRDDIDAIWYPDHWGCFGGGVELGEDPVASLHRELREELGIDTSKSEIRLFTELEFDLRGLGLGKYFRKYYTLRMTLDEVANLRLAEGQGVASFNGDEILGDLTVSPYDAFALFLHARGHRITK